MILALIIVGLLVVIIELCVKIYTSKKLKDIDGLGGIEEGNDENIIRL